MKGVEGLSTESYFAGFKLDLFCCFPDPFAVARNVARTMMSQPMFDYFLHCLKTTYKYFSHRPSHLTANHKPASQPSPSQSLTPHKASGEAKPKANRYLNHAQSAARSPRQTAQVASRRRQNSHCTAEEELEEEDGESSDLLEEEESEEEDDSEEEEVMNREEKR